MIIIKLLFCFCNSCIESILGFNAASILFLFFFPVPFLCLVQVCNAFNVFDAAINE